MIPKEGLFVRAGPASPPPASVQPASWSSALDEDEPASSLLPPWFVCVSDSLSPQRESGLLKYDECVRPR